MINIKEYNFQVTYRGMIKTIKDKEKLMKFLDKATVDDFSYMSIRLVQKDENEPGCAGFTIIRKNPPKGKFTEEEDDE